MKQNEWIQLKKIFPLSVKDTAVSLGIMLGAMLLCMGLQLIDTSHMGVSMVFILAVLIISRLTNGYFYGTAASFLGVFGVNYFFAYPYFEFNFSLAGYPITFFSMLAVAIITSTMTSQIKQQENIRIQAEKEKMRSNLLRAISHDLRTPLTSILGASSAVIDNDDVLTKEKRRELLCEVKEDAEWLIRMVENLLSITRIGGQAAQITTEPEAVEEVVGEAIRKFKKRFMTQAVTVKVPNELLMVPMDAILIEQVMINLLENAVLHSKTETAISVAVYVEDYTAIFEVSDNGKGIDEAVFPHLFDGVFRQADEEGIDTKRNMGIGLSVCMSIIKAHGGIMEAENKVSGGALFRFTLPTGEEGEQ